MITSINEFKQYLENLQQVNETILTGHFNTQFNLRAIDTLEVRDASGDKLEILERVKLLLKKFKQDLEKYPATAEKKLRLFDFGDIMIKRATKIIKPTFRCKKTYEGSQTYQGSVFCVPVYGNQAATILLFDRDADITDKLKQVEDHFRNNATDFGQGIDQFASIEHVYLGKKATVIDMNISMEEYIDKLDDKQPVAITRNTTIDELEYEVKADYQKETVHRQGRFNYKKGSAKADTYGQGIIISSERGMNGNWTNVVVKFQNTNNFVTFPRLLAKDFFTVAA